jgi:hypothetical protein
MAVEFVVVGLSWFSPLLRIQNRKQKEVTAELKYITYNLGFRLMRTA